MVRRLWTVVECITEMPMVQRPLDPSVADEPPHATAPTGTPSGGYSKGQKNDFSDAEPIAEAVVCRARRGSCARVRSCDRAYGSERCRDQSGRRSPARPACIRMYTAP